MNTNHLPISSSSARICRTETARGLANAPVRITLIDKTTITYLTAFVSSCDAGLSLSNCIVEERFRKQKTLFQMGEASTINFDEKFKLQWVGYRHDYLVVAVGGQTSWLR
jgi:NADH dehydrogenase FAD-containing subunit